MLRTQSGMTLSGIQLYHGKKNEGTIFKAKGRNLQKWTRERLIEELEIHEEDVESRSMGVSGEDLIMAS